MSSPLVSISGSSRAAGGSAAKERAGSAAGVTTLSSAAPVFVSAATPARCATRGALPSHVAARTSTPSDRDAGCTFNAYSFASIPFGNSIRETPIPALRTCVASASAARSPASSRSYAIGGWVEWRWYQLVELREITAPLSVSRGRRQEDGESGGRCHHEGASV